MSKGVGVDVRWDPPGPGQWTVDRSHMPKGATRVVQHIATTAMAAGTRRTFAELGAPLDCIQPAFVNGQFYSRIRPLVGADKAPTRLPPVPLLKLMVRLHPAMRRRNATAARAMEAEPWLQVIHDWHHGGKAAIEAENLRLQRVDRAALDDEGVVAHVHACMDHCLATWEHHFWLHGYDLGPLGQLLYDAAPWGLSAGELLALLEGASPSTSAPARALAEIRAAIEARGAMPATLDEARALSPDIAAMIDAYLERRGSVLFSRYDVDGITLGERPDLVLAGILNAEVRDTTAEVAARTAAARAKVPAVHRERFDVLVRQARDAMDLRDDNGPTTAEWPLGILRHALLELGARLVGRGLVDDPGLAFELAPSEVGSVLHGSPDGATLAARRAERAAQARLDPPDTIGPPEPAPPPDVLPAALQRLVGMVQTVTGQLGFAGADGGHGLSGHGVGTSPVTGRARVATSPEAALDALEPGDVLVVAGTTPAYNLVISLAGGLVTADGGPMCHAAVIARELGIPAVIGARAALVDIPDGAMVTVDPVAGVVTVHP